MRPWIRKGLNCVLLGGIGLACSGSADPLPRQQENKQTAPSTRRAPTPAPMSRADKIRSWKGEKVVLLPSEFLYDMFPAGKVGDINSAIGKSYQAKPGVVIEAPSAQFARDPSLTIALDGTGETIVSKTEGLVGFWAELEKARLLEGKTLWTRGQLLLYDPATDPTRSNDRLPFIVVPPAESVTGDVLYSL